MKYRITELCSSCKTDVSVRFDTHAGLPKCPNCGATIYPCSLCNIEDKFCTAQCRFDKTHITRTK